MVKQRRKRDDLMAKQKKRSKELEYAVKYLKEAKGWDVTKIATELGVASAIVDAIYNEIEEPEPRTPSKAQNMMIRHSSAKKINNVSIMTEAASQYNDEMRSKTVNNSNRHSNNSIFRPNG